MLKKPISLLTILISISTYSQFGFERYDTIDVIKSNITQLYPWAGGMDYCQFSNIDLDYDGTEDLFVFDRTCDKVLTFIQTGPVGTANFIYAPEYESLFPDDLHDWVLLVDYNCDGKKDIYTYAIGGVRVFANTGDIGSGLMFQQTSPILETWLWGSYNFLYTSSVDIPSIIDIDLDGDIDILSFSVGGTTVEYYKNLSMETYGVCDSLVYETKNRCWGRFREDGATNLLALWDTLTDPCDEDPLMNEEMILPVHGWQDQRADRHSGSSLLALDMNGSGVMDLVIGDISYQGLILLNNSGTAPNMNSGMDAQFVDFPLSSLPVDIPVFPAGYHVDINNDGIRDLMVTPNSTIGSDNRIGSWWYTNNGTDNFPDFQFIQNDFLQGDMIDQGTGSYPVFFDHNGDGLKDLLVSCLGMYVAGDQVSKIAYYENTGTVSNPEFTFITDDYQNISQLGIGASLVFYPTFGDLDNDGDEDMILGEFIGYCYYLENTGGAGNPAIFNTFVLLEDDIANPIYDGTYAYPTLVDLDRDNDLDLVIGRRNGMLYYYDNVGSSTTFSFQYITDQFGDVDVSEYWTIEGHAIPQFIDIDTNYQLILGAQNGFLHYYDSIDGNLGGVFNLVDSTLEDLYIGTYSAPAIFDIDNDGQYEMILGNRRGGVALFKSGAISDIGITENEFSYMFSIYPNPADELFTIDFGNISNDDLKSIVINIHDVSGRIIDTFHASAIKTIISLNNYSRGTYMIRVTGKKGVSVQKLILK